MEKEILTHERILRDYEDKRRRDVKKLMIPLIVLLCLSALLLFATIRLIQDEGFVFPVVLYNLILLFWDFIFVAAIITDYKSYQDIKNKRYYVVTDEVVGKQEAERYYSRLLRSFSKPAEIKFRTYGGYFPNMKHAADSSDRFVISDADNFYVAFTGDEFWLVIDKKSQILLIYNTKFFEYHS